MQYKIYGTYVAQRTLFETSWSYENRYRKEEENEQKTIFYRTKISYYYISKSLFFNVKNSLKINPREADSKIYNNSLLHWLITWSFTAFSLEKNLPKSINCMQIRVTYSWRLFSPTFNYENVRSYGKVESTVNWNPCTHYLDSTVAMLLCFLYYMSRHLCVPLPIQ